MEAAYVPEACRAIPTRRGQQPAVGAELHAEDVEFVATERSQLFAGRRIPQQHPGVHAAGGQKLPIRAIGDTEAPPPARGRVCCSLPVAVSQSLISPVSASQVADEVASCRPSGLKAAPMTGPVWPGAGPAHLAGGRIPELRFPGFVREPQARDGRQLMSIRAKDHLAGRGRMPSQREQIVVAQAARRRATPSPVDPPGTR